MNIEKSLELDNIHKKMAYFGVGIFGVLVFIGLYLLSASQTGLSIQTPWQIISPYYIYVFFAATLTLGLLIFSHLPTRYVIGLLVVYSFLLHAYLPLTHPLIYGADGWRHMANEAQLLEGHWPIPPAVRDGAIVIPSGKSLSQLSSPPQPPPQRGPASWRWRGSRYWIPVLTGMTTTDRDSSPPKGGFGMTASKLRIGDLAYGGFWILSAGVSALSGLGLITVTKWLVPVLWSLFFPILSFSIFKKFGWSDKKSLFAVWLCSLPFALQVAGSFSLPVNLGFLVWLVGVLLILKRIDNGGKNLIKWLLVFGVLSIFNYTLYFVLFWMMWGVGELVREWIRRHGKLSLKFAVLIGALCGFGLVTLQLAGGFSKIATVSWLAQVKQLIGNFTGWYLVYGPRPHVIDAGNIVFNQVPSYAFVSNLFTAGRLWIVPFTILFFVAVGIGAKMFVRRHHALTLTVVLFSAGLFGSYIISRYFMGGENVLARRFDVVLAFLFVIFAAESVGWLVEHSRHRLSIAIIFVFSFAIAASYSLGPNTNTASVGEYQAMQYIWSQEKSETKHCVIADTYPLLALEAISAKQIVGGGFPIDSNFAQPELQTVYKLFKTDSSSAVELGKSVTGARKCWIVEGGLVK